MSTHPQSTKRYQLGPTPSRHSKYGEFGEGKRQVEILPRVKTIGSQNVPDLWFPLGQFPMSWDPYFRLAYNLYDRWSLVHGWYWWMSHPCEFISMVFSLNGFLKRPSMDLEKSLASFAENQKHTEKEETKNGKATTAIESTGDDKKSRATSSIYTNRVKSSINALIFAAEALELHSRAISLSNSTRTKGTSLYNQASMRQQQQQKLLFKADSAPKIPLGILNDYVETQPEKKEVNGGEQVNTQEWKEGLKDCITDGSKVTQPKSFALQEDNTKHDSPKQAASNPKKSHIAEKKAPEVKATESPVPVDIKQCVHLSPTEPVKKEKPHIISIQALLSNNSALSAPSFENFEENSPSLQKIPIKVIRRVRGFNGLRKNAASIVYIVKSIALNTILFALVLYLNTYNTKHGVLFGDDRQKDLIYTASTFCFEHAFLVVLAVISVVTNNNFAILGSMVMNVLLCIIEMAYYGHQMAILKSSHTKKVLIEMSSTTLSSLDIISSDLQQARENVLRKTIVSTPMLAYCALLGLLVVSLFSEVGIYFFWLNRENASNLQEKRHSVSFKLIKKLEASQIVTTACFLNTACAPAFFAPFTYSHASEPLVYLNVVALFFILVQQLLIFLSWDILWLQLYMLLFNLILLIQTLSRLGGDGGSPICILSLFVIAVVAFPTILYLIGAIVARESKSEQTKDQIDVHNLVCRVKLYRRVLLTLCVGTCVLFNSILFGAYLGFSLSYQWFIVLACVNVGLVPAMMISLDSSGQNFNSYTAIVALISLEMCTFIFGYVSILYQLQVNVLTSEAFQLLGILLYSIIFWLILYFFTRMKRVHSAYIGYLANSAVIKVNERWNSLERLLAKLGPLMHVRGYLTITLMSLVLNYGINDVRYPFHGHQAIPLMLIAFTFISLWISRISGVVMSKSSSKVYLMACFGSLAALTFTSLICQVYVMLLSARSLGFFRKGSANIEIRFQVGTLVIANIGAILELAIEFMILASLLNDNRQLVIEKN